jgi:hypothetical protein
LKPAIEYWNGPGFHLPLPKVDQVKVASSRQELMLSNSILFARITTSCDKRIVNVSPIHVVVFTGRLFVVIRGGGAFAFAAALRLFYFNIDVFILFNWASQILRDPVVKAFVGI